MIRGLVASVILSVCLAGCSTAPDPDVPPVAPKPPEPKGLTAIILPGSDLYAVREVYSVIVRFQNEGNEPAFVLKPLDGSTVSWLMPYYRFTVVNTDGKTLEPSPRCGNHGLWQDTKWPQDYLVEIKPGKSFDVEVPLSFGIRKDGRYTIAFEYVYQPVNEALAPPPEAWRGTLKTPPTSVYLRLTGAPAQ
jgi:hypothetical protein